MKKERVTESFREIKRERERDRQGKGTERQRNTQVRIYKESNRVSQRHSERER